MKTHKNMKSATDKRLIDVYRKHIETLARDYAYGDLESSMGRYVLAFEEILKIEMFFGTSNF